MQERRLEAALASMVDPVVVVSAVSDCKAGQTDIVDFVVTYANGRADSPPVGALFSGLRPDLHPTAMVRQYRRVLAGEDLTLDGVFVPRRDGTERYLDVRASRLDDREVITTWRDVTDRAEAAQSLAESEALLRGMFDEAPVAALLVKVTDDGDGHLLRVSRPFSALLRYAPHELLGMPFSRLLYSDEDQPATSPGIAAILSQPGELRLCTADGQPVWVRVSSFGVSLADRTAYRVVHVERVINRRGVSGAVLNRSALRLNVEREARNAMANGWLVLHYQPVIDLRTSQLTGAEALLRIAHPEHGLLAPGVFIDALEDSDLILPIGDWVLGEACCQLRRWQDALGIKEFSMAVNISGRQASDRALSGRALAAAASAGIDPHSLCLEMTERVLIAADEPVVAGLRHLTAEGVRIALDDFGTGYASLSYLQRFPVSVLKIDRSFVTGVGVTPTDSAIVASIVALGQALDLEVVAEGVETANQLKQLRMHQCSKAQGFFFAPPLTAEDFEAHWRRKLRTNLSGVVNTRSARRHG